MKDSEPYMVQGFVFGERRAGTLINLVHRLTFWNFSCKLTVVIL